MESSNQKILLGSQCRTYKRVEKPGFIYLFNATSLILILRLTSICLCKVGARVGGGSQLAAGGDQAGNGGHHIELVLGLSITIEIGANPEL